MTRDEIMKLEGRELDAAVADRVMGWERHPRPTEQEATMGILMTAPGKIGAMRNQFPHYSTDIAAAWQVI